jgi:transcriptional regulator of acetoin/glycerol metabolism
MDIGLILASLLRRVAKERADQFSLTREAARALLCYRWPLNIREFLKCLEPAVNLAEESRIHLDDLPEVLHAILEENPVPIGSGGSVNPPFEFDKDRCAQLRELLKEYEGKIAPIARKTGRDRALIRRWIRQCGLHAEDFRKK